MPLPPAVPHPDFPVGCKVRVRELGSNAAFYKGRFVGLVGRVLRSTRWQMYVEFPWVTGHCWFTPHQLERADDPAPPPVGGAAVEIG
jgi:hypothetical protein